MKARERRLAELKRAIVEVTPQEAFAQQARGAALIDVREADEIAQGAPTGALRLGRGFLELRIEEVVADPERRIIVLCGSGMRSLFAARKAPLGQSPQDRDLRHQHGKLLVLAAFQL